MKSNSQNIKLPEDFDWLIYLKLNTDLNRKSTKKEVIEHYKKHGIKENRKYKVILPDDFNWRGYLYLNKDLYKFVKKEECIEHYINHGYFENRKYTIKVNEDFNWLEYLEQNADLKDKIKNEKSAIQHYLKKGFFENRPYKKRIDIHRDLNTFDSYYNNIPIDNNYENHNQNLYYDELHDNNIIRTILINKEKNSDFLKFNVSEDIVDKIHNFVLIIDFFNGGGGTTFFLNTIVSKYKNYQTFVIVRNINGNIHININEEYNISKKYNLSESIYFLEKYANKIEKIFVNHLLGHDNLFIQKVFNLNKEVIGITHDYYNLTKIYQPFYHEIDNFNKINPPLININNYNHIITQNIENLYIFKKYYKNKISVVPLPDYLYKEDKIEYTKNRHKITIGIIGNIINIKGREILIDIINYYKNDQNIEIIVLGIVNIPNFYNYFSYDTIDELNSIICDKEINVLLELSLWPETYSYTLTLSMSLDLPILYLEKKYNSVIKNRLANYAKSHKFNNLVELDLLVKKYNQNWFCKVKPVVCYSKFWNDLFITKTHKLPDIQPNLFKYNIQPYFIYFPQFHNIRENNLLFYDGFNDIKNLEKYNKENSIKMDEPDLSYLNISRLEHYDLTNADIIQRNINLIHDYGGAGFAIYYYWFSNNNITNEHMIMNRVIDMFFSGEVDLKNKKIFFIWANEDWTNNNAFGVNLNYQIKNIYDTDNFQKNATNLIIYFKHPNYLKIDNKPVFFIYHNYLIEDKIDIFYDILNKMCIDNGYDGVHIVLNSFIQKDTNYKNFYINFNYKKYESRFIDTYNKQYKIDYHNYIFNPYHLKEKTIQTLVFDFNNRARLFIPNRLEHSTICIDNREIDKKLFSDMLINTYNYEKTSELDNILLVNSFNEWGESMAFEPSKKYGYYNLNLLTECLCFTN
jgi:hypothetical protein